MGLTTPNISIYIPSAGETNYDASFSAGMFNIDQHDHSGGPNNGVPIASSGIDDGAVTYQKLASNVADNNTGIGTNGALGANQLALLGLLKNIYLISTTSGFISKNGSLAEARTLTSADPTNGINISNGDGVSGNPTFSLPTLSTYSPVLAFGGGSTGITYAVNGQIGKYWRLGNVIYFNISIQLTSKGSSSGNATITLPPFLSSNDEVFQCCATQAFLDSFPVVGPNTSTYIVGEIPPNSSTVNLVACGSGIQFGVSDTNFANFSEIQMSGFYWTT